MTDSRSTIDGRTKGVPASASLPAADLAAQGWNVAAGDTATPVAVLRDDALRHNIAVMADFCRRSGVALAPHGKTTMSAELIGRQLEAGAWGITAASVQQAAVFVSLGVRRVFIANEVVDPHALGWLAARLDADPGLDITWYVDSDEGLLRAGTAFDAAARRPGLLVELGHPDGRTGVRDDDRALRLARAVAADPRVDLVGVSGYEGTIGTGRDDEAVGRVVAFLSRLGRLFERAADEGLLATGAGPIVSAGGSVYFDLVAQRLGPLAGARGATVLLRSGCYLTHDHGLYARSTPTTRDGWGLPPFRPALEVWTRVLSRPEPGLALLDAGRRDVSFDAGLPVALRAVDGGGGALTLDGAEVVGLSDQHAFLAISASSDLTPGDLVALGVSHPCTTFDRWAQLLLVDEKYDVVGSVRTGF